MPTSRTREKTRLKAIDRPERSVPGDTAAVSSYFGENVFDVEKCKDISKAIKAELAEVATGDKKLSRESAQVIAKAVTEWAVEKGATHFCHWFQPLTGSTAEKHDAFLSLDKDGKPIEKLSASQLMQGEPDASSFPNGGSRSTFEARGYTSWDITSPLFLLEGGQGKTLCIPTAFVSYHGDALDIKTPLLRSVTRINKTATEFLNLIGHKESKRVQVTCGCEQEYFLVDKGFYYSRPDLVMTGRTLLGSLTARNQQLEDHYFGTISDRVLSFMQELDYELYKLGIPAKTRHNEVAPGQFEIAPIFTAANVAADHNQLVMAIMRKVAEKHNFVALLHEKPFAGVNGSGKHMNWSMCDNNGLNLLEPGDDPHENHRFLAVVAIIIEAVYRHADAIRMSISGHGNDHRLGANEAPPSIISVFLGDTLDKIYQSIKSGASYSPSGDKVLDMGAHQLVHLLKDNTDRNRTSPFAFTGNKFEVRAVGSSQAVGFPMSILNAAVAEVMEESNAILAADIQAGKSVDEALLALTKKWIDNAYSVVFNGDGYSDEWVQEAAQRGLPNLRNTADALKVLTDSKACEFLSKQMVYNESELMTRYNVLLERYNKHREIEFQQQIALVRQNVIPAALDYKMQLGEVIERQGKINLESSVEIEIYKKVNFALESLHASMTNLENAMKGMGEDEAANSEKFANDLLPLSETVADHANVVEELVPDSMWGLPKYYDMLFLR